MVKRSVVVIVDRTAKTFFGLWTLANHVVAPSTLKNFEGEGYSSRDSMNEVLFPRG